jgi:hypothetical protein
MKSTANHDIAHANRRTGKAVKGPQRESETLPRQSLAAMQAHPFSPYALTQLHFTSTLEEAAGSAILLCHGARVASISGVGQFPSAQFARASAQQAFETHLECYDRSAFFAATGKHLPGDHDAASVFLTALIEYTVRAQEQRPRVHTTPTADTQEIAA